MSSVWASATGCETQARTFTLESKRRELKFSAMPPTALSENRDHNFARDHALNVYRGEAIYSFIPKNACSTLRFSIAVHNGCITNESDILWIHKNNATFRASLRELLLAKYTFVVLRCPYRRIVSLFLDKIAGHEDNRLRALLAPRWRRPLVSHQRYRERITFRCFLQLLLEPGALELDHHWTPQARFLVYKDYDDYFKVEAFDDARKRLAEIIDLNLQDARGLTDHGTHALRKITISNAADIPASELRSMRNEGCIPDYSDFFDTGSRSLVQRLYREDIDLYSVKFGDNSSLMNGI